MKILHITTNNKFIGHALQTFENVYPKQNSVWMLDGLGGELENPHVDVCCKFTFFQTLNPLFSLKLKKYDLVVLHSLPLTWFFIILFAPLGTRFAWVGWGFDYYDFIFKKESDMLLDCSERLWSRHEIKKSREKSVKSVIEEVTQGLLAPIVFRRIASFSPVLHEDYQLIQQARIVSYLPCFVVWNYGSLEENLVENFIGKRICGDSILVGNSASYTNNHIEALSLLEELNITAETGRKVIVPLSYGDKSYQQEIIRYGESIFKGGFQPLIKFMEIDEYVTTIKECGFVIMNQIRQQALGNIIIMLYLGARVFLREESPVYRFLKLEGVFVNTVQELKKKPVLLQLPLTESQIINNVEILYKHWSKEVIDKKTRGLVEFHLMSNVRVSK